MIDDDDDRAWPLILRTGFGNIFDIGYGWDHRGQTLIATALNAGSTLAKGEAWSAVEDFCRQKHATEAAC